MSNPSKRKGTAWETEIVTTLRDHGHDSARRVVQAGAADVGDIHLGGILSPLVAIEAKNEKALTISTYVDEAKIEGDNAGALFGGVAWVKRRGKTSARDGYVIMDGQTFIDILAALDTRMTREGALPQHVIATTQAERTRSALNAIRGGAL